MTHYCSIVKTRPDNPPKYHQLLNSCLNQVLAGHQGLDQWVLELDGMSGRLYREFINLLIKQIDNPRYLEIGAWQGSTACSAILNNNVTATVVDNWSQFDGPRDIFFSNLARAKGTNLVNVLESDFRQIDWTQQPKHNVYMFDGPHALQDQYDALVMVQHALDQEFVLIVDDWHAESVKQGTNKALDELGWTYSSIMIETTPDGSAASWCRQHSDWHNGYLLAAVNKGG